MPACSRRFRDVLLQMVITSDNTATDLAIAKVGGVARVNAWLKEYGLRRRAAADADHRRAVREVQRARRRRDDRNAKTNGDRAVLARRDHAARRRADARGDREEDDRLGGGCDDMLRMMRAQQAGARRLQPLHHRPVAHKTGDFPPVLANDVGIIYARSGPIVVSFLGNAITGNYGEAEDRIGRFARSRLVEYLR